ncbi:tau 95 subunit of transcription factor TFIIIC [Tulasnella sp. JGI-2019a]|nr:tau 95 subunit of transcription factor TFIIIC [Tulasnella sp. JGI-2019a]
MDINENEEQASYELAPSLLLPRAPFYSVEYPGYVSPTPEAFTGALRTLGGQSSVDKVFKKPRAKILDLNLRPDDLFIHPIPGEAVNSSKILLKITTRRRRKKLFTGKAPEGATSRVTGQTWSSRPDPISAVLHLRGTPQYWNGEAVHFNDMEMPLAENTNEWEAPTFTTEALGTINKTVRFRAMADFQYAPDPMDSMIQLRKTMQKLDQSTLDAITNFQFDEEKEDYSLPLSASPPDDPTKPQNKSNLRLPPFPLFSRATIPAQYNYKANVFSVVQTVTDPITGEEKQRMINKTRFKGFGTLSIAFHDPGPVPTGLTDYMAVSETSVNQALLQRVRELFEKRPIWARNALFAQFSLTERREIFHSKILIPLASYGFSDGPFRDTYIRFGYDPRKDPEARFFQRVTFRYTNPAYEGRRRAVTEGPRPSDVPKQQQTLLEQPYIFDGKTMQQEVGPGFQLCDIHDAFLQELINDTKGLRTECDARDGWYSATAFECIKQVTRRKLFSLIDEGRIVSDAECVEIVEKMQAGRKTDATKSVRPEPAKKQKARSRNKAKGVIPAEEEAAERLKKTLRRQKEEGLVEECSEEDDYNGNQEIRSDSNSDHRG